MIFILGLGAVLGLFIGLMRVKEKSEPQQDHPLYRGVSQKQVSKSESHYIIFSSIVIGLILMGIFALLMSGN
jgi:hypothetical protein